MKKKFLKSAATMLTVCVGTMAASTALATSVTTTTEYRYENDSVADSTVSVTTNVNAAGANSMIAYFVSRNDESAESGKKIVFIDQKTADASGNTSFNFVAKQADLFGTEDVTLKFGSNVTPTDAFPTFTFKKGINFISSGTATVTNPTLLTGLASGEFGAMANVSGNVTEYGFVLSDGTNSQDLKAYGSVAGEANGTYAVIIAGISDTAGLTLKPYVIGADGTRSEGAVATVAE